jgi:hypothetical protein
MPSRKTSMTRCESFSSLDTGLYGKRAGINPAPYGKGGRNDDQGQKKRPNRLKKIIREQPKHSNQKVYNGA